MRRRESSTSAHGMKRLWVVAALLVGSLIAPLSASGQATPDASPMAGVTPIAGVGDSRWWQGATCYEIFVRSFYDSDGDGNGDLQGLIEKLDYLNDGDPGTTGDLGVTCLWLMPVMESVSYHGYDVTDYYAIESDYGTNEDFLQLMEEAHTRGIRIIVDLVINHTSSAHPWFQDAVSNPDSPYRDWYIFEPEDPGYGGPWGAQAWHPTPAGDEFYYGLFWSGMPDLNYRNPEVTAETERITEFWLTEMNVDGFRLDAIKHIIEDGTIQENTPETIDWLRDYSAFIRSVKPDAYTVGEVAGLGTDGPQPYYPDTLDQYFQFELANETLNASQFGNAALLAGILEDAVERIPDQRFATFLTNHDQPRVGTRLGENENDMRVAAMLLLSTPGTPFVYYGEEICMVGDKPDERIRTPMEWSSEPNAGFSTATPWEPLQDGWETRNVAVQEGVEGSLLETYRSWIQLRAEHPALRTGDFTLLETDLPGLFAFLRHGEGETLLVLINLSNEASGTIQLTLPAIVAGSGALTATDLIGDATVEAGSATDGAGIQLDGLDAKDGTVIELHTSG